MVEVDARAMARKLARRIEPIVAKEPLDIQGAVLAGLLLTWVLRHGAKSGNPRATRKIRELLLRHHTTAVWRMVKERENGRDAADGGVP